MAPKPLFFKTLSVLAATGALLLAGRALAQTPTALLDSAPQQADWLQQDLQVAEAAPAAAAPGGSAQQPAAASSATPTGGKLPGVASGLAVAPGVLVHGSGHFYAGRPLTGAVLVAAEAVSLYMVYRGVRDIYSQVDAIDFDTFSNFDGNSGQISNGLGLAAGGLMIFLASWLYDITGSAQAVEADEAARRQSVQANVPTVTPRITPQGVEVVVDRLF